MSKYAVLYKYRKIGATSQTGANAVVEAESDSTAISIVRDKHPDCDVFITSVTKKG
jgi:hypothetical protein